MLLFVSNHLIFLMLNFSFFIIVFLTMYATWVSSSPLSNEDDDGMLSLSLLRHKCNPLLLICFITLEIELLGNPFRALHILWFRLQLLKTIYYVPLWILHAFVEQSLYFHFECHTCWRDHALAWFFCRLSCFDVWALWLSWVFKLDWYVK